MCVNLLDRLTHFKSNASLMQIIAVFHVVQINSEEINLSFLAERDLMYTVKDKVSSGTIFLVQYTEAFGIGYDVI